MATTQRRASGSAAATRAPASKKPAVKTAKATAKKPAGKTAKAMAKKPAAKTAKATARKPAASAKATARKPAASAKATMKTAAKPAARTAAARSAKPAATARPAANASATTLAAAPVRPTPPAPTPPAPAGPPRPPAPDVELAADLDVFRLTRYGERIGPYRIEIQMLPAPLATAGRIAVADPAARAGAVVLARQVFPGRYRCTLSTIQVDGAPVVAAAVLHVGKGPVARWVFAHAEGKRAPRTPDEVRGYEVTSGRGAFVDAASLDRAPDPAAPPAADAVEFPAGKGAGTYRSYWGLDADGVPAALVTDFAVFTKKDWKAKPA